MRTILPFVALAWGLAILVTFAVSGVEGTGAYASGQLAALAAAVVMVGFSARALLTRYR